MNDFIALGILIGIILLNLNLQSALIRLEKQLVRNAELLEKLLNGK